MRRPKSLKISRNITNLLPLLLAAIIFLPYTIGENVNRMNSSNVLLENHSISPALVSKIENQEHSHVITPLLLFLIVSFAISIVLSVLKLDYLNTPSLVKPCTLVFLLKDIIKICMAMHCVWLAAVVIRELSGNDHNINQFQAKIICFSFLGLVLLFLVLLILTAAFKVYLMKTMMVDPPMPWGEHKNLGMNIIRAFCGMLVLGSIITMYAFGKYPKIYYTYIGHPESSMSLPDEILILLLTIFIIISLGAKYYQRTHQDNIDTEIPRQVHYTMWMISLIFALGFFAEMFNALELRNRWKLYQISIALGGVITPMVVILRTDQLKSHVKNKLHDMAYLNVKFVFLCLSLYALTALCVN